MKRFIFAPILMLILLISAPEAIAAQPKSKAKARSGAVKRSSSKSSSTLTWIGDIPAPKYMLKAWENKALNNSFNNLLKALEARGYYESGYDYCKSGVACIRFTGGRLECDVILTIPNPTLRSQYYQAAKKAFRSSQYYSVIIDGDEIMLTRYYN